MTKLRHLRIIIAVFFFVTAINIPELKIKANETKTGIDVIILIDKSGSMLASDKERIAIEASKLFIDMIETTNSRIGVLAFSDNIIGIKELTEISSYEDKEKLKDDLDSFDYDGYTDIGMSLNMAVSTIMDDINDNNSPMILLLTDGKIEIDPENPHGRTIEDSMDDINSALSQVGRDIPIYTIGLDYNREVDRSLLQHISGSTMARNYIITEAGRLPQIFNEIFADHIKSTLVEAQNITSDGQNYVDVKINIDSYFVSEANIIMLSSYGLIDAKLFDPNGREVTFDGKTANFSVSEKYAVIKVLAPKNGDWILQVKGVQDDKIKINLIYQYNVDINIITHQQDEIDGKYNLENPINVESQFFISGETITDESLYESTSAFLILEDINGNILQKIEMRHENGKYVAEYMPENAETLALYVQTENEDFSRETKKLKIEFLSDEPYPVPDHSASPPDSAPVPDSPIQQNSSSNILALTLIALATMCILLVVVVLIYIKERAKMLFSGYLEVRAMGEDRVYLPLETPSLHTFVGKTDLKEFFTSMLKHETVEKMDMNSMNLQSIELRPAVVNSQNALTVTNKSLCKILDENGNIVEKKTFNWFNGQHITILDPSNSEIKIETTYRIEEI